MRSALALAVFVVPVFVVGASFGLDALALTCFSIEKELRCTDLDLALAFAFIEVKVLTIFACSWRANPVAKIRIPLSARWLCSIWQALAFTLKVVPITLNAFSRRVQNGLACFRDAFTAAADFIPRHSLRALLRHTLASAPL